ncbi:MAG: four helix bundle protein [Gammaproteobacteria bacterium]
MSSPAFSRLDIYRAAARLADRIWHHCRTWSGFECDAVGVPLVRAADRVGAAIAASIGHASADSSLGAVGEARAALKECFFRMRRAYQRGLLSGSECAQLQLAMAELEGRLLEYAGELERGPDQGGVREPEPFALASPGALAVAAGGP